MVVATAQFAMIDMAIEIISALLGINQQRGPLRWIQRIWLWSLLLIGIFAVAAAIIGQPVFVLAFGIACAATLIAGASTLPFLVAQRFKSRSGGIKD